MSLPYLGLRVVSAFQLWEAWLVQRNSAYVHCERDAGQYAGVHIKKGGSIFTILSHGALYKY